MLRLALVLCLLSPAVALADAIDGSWCSEKGAHVSIEGPKISLGGKPAIDGQYARHEFLYQVPAGEDQAGDLIYMRLRGEEDMTSYTVKDGKGEDPVAWKRCAETS
ncbi:MAG: hypothetical protein KGO53_09855 [Alphaproteobacteria bacterium]|nr:hypothetical protein [Alphaproteobacteria bacterium]